MLLNNATTFEEALGQIIFALFAVLIGLIAIGIITTIIDIICIIVIIVKKKKGHPFKGALITLSISLFIQLAIVILLIIAK